jgi:hypothetical protein
MLEIEYMKLREISASGIFYVRDFEHAWLEPSVQKIEVAVEQTVNPIGIFIRKTDIESLIPQVFFIICVVEFNIKVLFW